MDTQETLKQSRRVLLALKEHSTSQERESAFLLYAALKKLGKDVAIEGGDSVSALFCAPRAERKTFAVTLKGLAPWISTLRYEKQEKDLKLYFTLSEGEVSSELLALESQESNDLTIIVGDKELPHNTISPSSREKITEKHAEVARAALEFLPPEEVALTRLIARALMTVKSLPSRDLLVFSLLRKDFRETGSSAKMLPALWTTIQTYAMGTPSCVILFEQERAGGIRELLWSKDAFCASRAAAMPNAATKGRWTLIDSPWNTVEEAEKNILDRLA